jgi:signal transduction histidine kinase
MNPTAPPLTDNAWYRFARRGVRVMGVGLLISLVMVGVYHHSPFPTLVYSLCITFGCWFFIDGGRILAARWLYRRQPSDARYGQWPGFAWMVAIVVVGTVLGYTFGATLGNAITGLHTPALIEVSARQAVGIVIGSMVPGIAAVYYFYSRERMASSDAAAQAAQRQAAENQLKLLESQLEPHMLFNTLANLRVLIGIDPPRAQAMLDRLIAFLRATLDASRNGSHSLASEFARIGDYLELMKIRMGERLQVELALPPDLAAQPVPPLLLQPLVENAIKHGLEPHVGGGRLVVSAGRDGDALVLKVRDTGVGMSDVPGGDGTRFGLRQVRERLATLHGTQARLELAAAGDADGGTLATVRLPLH